jgi:putative transposase
MARNFYSEINLHLVWRTKDSMALLTPDVEAVTHQHLRQYIAKTPGAFFHAVGGIEDHVHVVVSILPTVHISELIGKLKGSSSHEVNLKLGGYRKLLEWQAGYGVVSFGTKDLEWVCAYARNQREHHARGTTFERLERVEALEELEAQAGIREAP